MENNTRTPLGAKLSNDQLMTAFNSELYNEVNSTDGLPCLKVSIVVAENTVNNNLIPSFLIKVSDQNQETAITASEVTVTLVYTATTVKGNDYTGRSTITFATGANTKVFEILDKIQLEEDLEKIVICITDVKSTGSEQVLIDEQNYCREIVITEHPHAYFNIEEVSIDEKAGIVEFDVSLSGDLLACDATVDYIIREAIAFDNDPALLSSGTLTFNPGITSHTVTIPIIEDAFEGYYGLFNVALTNAVNAIIIDKSKISSLTETGDTDSESAFVSIAASTLAVNEDNAAAFKVELRDSTGHFNTALTDVTVEVLYSAISMDNTDFVGIEKVVIPANSSSVDFEITALDEYISEVSDTINIELIQAIGGNFKTLSVDYSQSSVDIAILDEC